MWGAERPRADPTQVAIVEERQPIADPDPHDENLATLREDLVRFATARFVAQGDINSCDSADDVVQEAMVRVLGRSANQSLRNLRAYCLTVVKHLVVDEGRRQNRMPLLGMSSVIDVLDNEHLILGQAR
jgi:DNA-directed RNA polymerase specialized sigma24 family protein